MNKVFAVAAALALLCLGSLAQADVFNLGPGLTNLETVTVGDPGNAGELSGAGRADTALTESAARWPTTTTSASMKSPPAQYSRLPEPQGEDGPVRAVQHQHGRRTALGAATSSAPASLAATPTAWQVTGRTGL